MAETEKKPEDCAKAPLLLGETSKTSATAQPTISGTSKAFAFWGYVIITVSLVTLLFISLARIERRGERSWFFSLPDGLRRHYSAGKLIKTLLPSGIAPIQVFAVEDGPREAETVLLVHGLGCSSYSFRRILQSLSVEGLRSVAVDLPGSGFSDEMHWLETSKWEHSLGWILSIYEEIREKGVFWGFDQLIQTGEIQERPAKVRSSDFGMVEMGQILGQVIDSMNLAPLHLVLHDSALSAGANWVISNPESVRSLTLMDASPQSAAFPSSLLMLPVLGHLLLSSKTMFAWLLRLCCVRSIDGLDAEAYRLAMKKKNGGNEVVTAWRALNHSFNVGEWANSDELKGLPVQVLWSNNLSDQWIDEARRVSAEIPRAKLSFHSGGRWPQEDAAEEISKLIANFVSSLPKSVRRVEEVSVPDHVKKMSKESKHHFHHQHDQHDDHGQNQGVDYRGMYGLGHGW